MFRTSQSLLPALLITVSLIGCDAFSADDDTSGLVTLTGQVLNDATNNPVSGAFVRVLPMDLLFETDADGQYSMDVEVDSTMDLQVIGSADGYSASSVTVLALAGRTIEVPVLRVFQFADEGGESGLASSILLTAQSDAAIGVRESGSVEVATLSFTVVDSVGRPVVLDKGSLVHFRFGKQPGGGETIAPAEAETDNNGKVEVTLSSGTRSGVVQIVAETQVSGRTVRSLPVAVTIHGGLPDQTHFSVGPQKFNFPGLNTFGLVNPIRVIVGDQYSNPVKPGTSVYFSTSYGVVEGAVQTDSEGRGAVNLLSANPLPPDGIGLVTASTADKDREIVVDSTPVIFSGVPVISVSPGSATVNQTYSLTVTDQNGNPLSSGTVITVEVEGTAVKGVGNTSVSLGDYGFSGGVLYQHVVRGPGVTQFTFRAAQDIDPNATNPQTPVVDVITISVTGPNGNLEVVLGGLGGAPRFSDGALVEHAGPGIVVARAPQPF